MPEPQTRRTGVAEVSGLSYRIRPKDPGAHLFEVALTIGDPDPEGQVIELPSWIPGSYVIREFAKHVVTIRAESDDRELALEKLDTRSARTSSIVSSPLAVD